MASGRLFAGWSTSPSGFPMGPQSQTDLDEVQDELDDMILRDKRQLRRWTFEAFWANLPGPETWKRR